MSSFGIKHVCSPGYGIGCLSPRTQSLFGCSPLNGNWLDIAGGAWKEERVAALSRVAGILKPKIVLRIEVLVKSREHAHRVQAALGLRGTELEGRGGKGLRCGDAHEGDAAGPDEHRNLDFPGRFWSNPWI